MAIKILEGLLETIEDMLLNPSRYSDLSIRGMCASLGVLNERLINAKCIYILYQDVNEQEYEKYFKELLTNNNAEELIDKIKKDYDKTGDKNDND